MSSIQINRDVLPLVLRYLSFQDLVNFGTVDRLTHSLVIKYLTGNISLPEDNASLPLYQRVRHLVGDLKRKAIRYCRQLFSNFGYYGLFSFITDFETVLNSPDLQRISLKDRIAYFSDLPKAMRILLGWEKLASNWAEKMPKCLMPFAVQDVAAIVEENRHSPVLMMKELFAKARECMELFKLHEELFKARSILMVWEELASLIPKEAQGDLIRGPGLDQLTSTVEIIAKAEEFKSWFNLFKSTIIAYANGELLLHNLGLTYLPEEICELTHLRQLRLEMNNLTTLPKGIGNLKELNSLRLSWNFLTLLPDEIFQLTQLRGLNVDHNQLTSISGQIGNLNQLGNLFLGYNQLSSIPAEICSIDPLWTLALNDNQLSSLPPEIVNLPNLLYLHLQHNRLREVPIEFLRNLSLSLFAEGNQIASLPLTTPRLIFSAVIRHNEFRDNPLSLSSRWALRTVHTLDWMRNQNPARYVAFIFVAIAITAQFLRLNF